MNDGKRLMFASNVNAEGFQFDLWTIGKDREGLERITTAPGFDGFPFSVPTANISSGAPAGPNWRVTR